MRWFYECLIDLRTCAALDDYWNEVGAPHPCESEETLVSVRCD